MGYAGKSVPAKVEAKFQNGVFLPWYFSPSPPWFLALVSSLHNPAQPLLGGVPPEALSENNLATSLFGRYKKYQNGHKESSPESRARNSVL